MFMFLKLAWGNVLKHRRDSMTIFVVVFVCVFFMMFGTAFMDGFKAKIRGDFLDALGHIKIYNRDYYKDLDFSLTDRNLAVEGPVADAIAKAAGIKNVIPEINMGAIANTESKSVECMVKAIDLSRIDADYGRRKRSVIKGRFIQADKEVVIGFKAAKSLRADTGSSLILLSVDQYGSINAVEGTVVGITQSNNAQEDEHLVVCGLPFAQRLLAIEGRVTEITVNLKDAFTAESQAAVIQAALPPEAIAVPWQKGQAFIVGMLKLLDTMVFLIASIVIFAASLGIINSFLMNVMNRLPEFGVLRAVGVSKVQVLLMILSESFLLGLAGTVAAMLPGTALVKYLETHPMNYEKIWSTMQGSALGAMDATMPTVFVPMTVLIVFMTGVLISVIASLYPALVAVKKKPSEILRVLE